jgi:hypothetical protein
MAGKRNAKGLCLLTFLRDTCLLKQFKEQNKPIMAYKDQVINFIDRTADFFLEKNMQEIANVFKGYVVELAEYLILRK